MRIGILTLPLHRNYGGILQHWALQQVLKQLGHEPVLIQMRYYAPVVNLKLVLLRCLSFFKQIAIRTIGKKNNKVICSPFARDYNTLFPRYADSKFVRNIPQTRDVYSDVELKHMVDSDKFDAFVVGSDQVWRQAYSPCIESYFLDFLPVSDKRKRIAYASSFGTECGDISDELIPKCKDLLGRFDAVSVREDGGLQLAQNKFGYKNAVKTLDPTLLLSSEHYYRIIKKSDKFCHIPYVATYILDDEDDKSAIVKAVTEHLNLPSRGMSVEYTGVTMPTISQWLAHIANAEFVVTDSFHGCVFSIIFHKPFIAIGNTERGLDRFKSLLSALSLTNRLINDNNEFISKSQELIAPIDYNTVDALLDKQRQFSINFLKYALS